MGDLYPQSTARLKLKKFFFGGLFWCGVCCAFAYAVYVGIGFTMVDMTDAMTARLW